MEIQFKLTEEDYLSVNRFFVLDIMNKRKYKNLFIILGVIFLILGILQIVTKGLFSSYFLTIFPLIMGCFFIISFGLLYPDYYAKKLIRNINNKCFLEQCKFIIQDESIFVERQTNSGNFNFEGVLNINENTDFIIFRISDNQMLPIPKKYLTSEQEENIHQIILNSLEHKYHKYK